MNDGLLLSLCTICNIMDPDDTNAAMTFEMFEVLLLWAEVFLALKIPS